MPNQYIKKLNSEGKGSIPALEEKWEKAKQRAEEQGQGNNWPYVNSIFKKMVGAGYTISFNSTRRVNMVGVLAAPASLADDVFKFCYNLHIKATVARIQDVVKVTFAKGGTVSLTTTQMAKLNKLCQQHGVVFQCFVERNQVVWHFVE